MPISYARDLNHDARRNRSRAPSEDPSMEREGRRAARAGCAVEDLGARPRSCGGARRAGDGAAAPVRLRKRRPMGGEGATAGREKERRPLCDSGDGCQAERRRQAAAEK